MYLTNIKNAMDSISKSRKRIGYTVIWYCTKRPFDSYIRHVQLYYNDSDTFITPRKCTFSQRIRTLRQSRITAMSGSTCCRWTSCTCCNSRLTATCCTTLIHALPPFTGAASTLGHLLPTEHWSFHPPFPLLFLLFLSFYSSVRFASISLIAVYAMKKSNMRFS